MHVLAYQVLIAIIIFISTFFGRFLRNITVLLLCLFTLFQVFTSWLVILQFITITISYFISESNSYLNDNKSKKRELNSTVISQNKNNYSIYYILLIVIVSIGYSAYVSLSKKSSSKSKLIQEKTNENTHTVTSNESPTLNETISYKDTTEYIADTINTNNNASYGLADEYETNDQSNEAFNNHEQSIYGNYIFVADPEINLEKGRIEITALDEHQFNFKIYVENKTDTGQIMGVANLINQNFGKHKTVDCEMSFIFNGKKVEILEYNCGLYHGNSINFNATFEK